MTMTKPQVRLRNADEEWGTYIEILSDELFVPAPKKDDYENFASYWTALDKHRKENDSKSCVNTLRALAASLQATDVPNFNYLEIRYYGGGDSGEIEEINLYAKQEDIRTGDYIPVELDDDLREALDETGWRLAYSLNPGFEISDGHVDGASGGITIYKKGDEWAVTVEHSQRYTEEHASTYEFS